MPWAGTPGSLPERSGVALDTQRFQDGIHWVCGLSKWTEVASGVRREVRCQNLRSQCLGLTPILSHVIMTWANHLQSERQLPHLITQNLGF